MTGHEAARLRIAELAARYPDRRAALVPALYIAQREFGWLSPEALRWTADTLGLPPATVRGTASFYSLFRHRRMGRHLIQLCTNVSCMMLGAETVQACLESRYGLEPGGTTEDGRFSLLIMECIGACDGAPAMMIDADLHGHLTPDRLDEVLSRY